jgi:hypothetical protein
MPFGQSGTLCGLRLVPAKLRGLVPGERQDGAQSRRAGTLERAYRQPLDLASNMY